MTSLVIFLQTLVTGPIGAGRTALVGALVAAAVDDVDETSSLVVISSFPLGEKQQLRQKDSWPSSFFRSSPVSAFHNFAELSAHDVAIVRPSLLILQPVT